jgi:hypothetical protein
MCLRFVPGFSFWTYLPEWQMLPKFGALMLKEKNVTYFYGFSLWDTHESHIQDHCPTMSHLGAVLDIARPLSTKAIILVNGWWTFWHPQVFCYLLSGFRSFTFSVLHGTINTISYRFPFIFGKMNPCLSHHIIAQACDLHRAEWSGRGS